MMPSSMALLGYTCPDLFGGRARCAVGDELAGRLLGAGSASVVIQPAVRVPTAGSVHVVSAGDQVVSRTMDARGGGW